MVSEVRGLTFQVQGSFITDITRSWFWDENKPYTTCEELLLSCLMTDQLDLDAKKRIVVEILEGRKKLTGVNTFYLEDDNENVRPLSLKIQQQEYANGVLWIKERMEVQAIDFVDPYSTVKSIKALRESHTLPKASFLDCLDWFTQIDSFREVPEYDDRYERYATKLGLWLFFQPEIAWKATKGRSVHIGSDDFWENVYQQVKDWEPDQSFKERNQRYLADLRMRNSKYQTIDNLLQRGRELLEKTIQETDKDSELNLDARVALDGLDSSNGDDSLLYVTVPDEILKWEGLISPKGDFYSCTFGGHNLKAYHIIKAHPEWFPKAQDGRFYMDDALDLLLASGWCATRYLPTCGDYIDIPPTDSGKRPTKSQVDTIWEAVVKHESKPGNLHVIDP